MTVEPLRPEVKRWWEGDLRMYVDGRRHPALQGTGHEDEYLGGWSNEWLMNPYTLPMHGEPKTANLAQVDFQWSAATTVYRFFPAGIPYQSQLVVSTEHGVDNGVPAMYSSVAYYYERADGMTLADTLDVGETADETAHRYSATPAAAVRSLTSRFEAKHGVSETTDRGRDVTGRSRFTLTAQAGHGVLRLRRLYDQATAQDAEVFVNGQSAGRWYTGATNQTRRWADSDFILPAALDAGANRYRGRDSRESAARGRSSVTNCGQAADGSSVCLLPSAFCLLPFCPYGESASIRRIAKSAAQRTRGIFHSSRNAGSASRASGPIRPSASATLRSTCGC
jgi:hypothetical protein